MAEYIECRNCTSPSCKGCNTYTLSQMLHYGKFDCLMNENRAIHFADVAPVVHGRWIDYHFIKTDCPKSGFPSVKCSHCGITFCDIINVHGYMYHYCPNCGADMRGDTDG